nr:MAG: RNA-dependent RNA polymerase [Wufeng shrew picorna-like virus 26]
MYEDSKSTSESGNHTQCSDRLISVTHKEDTINFCSIYVPNGVSDIHDLAEQKICDFWSQNAVQFHSTNPTIGEFIVRKLLCDSYIPTVSDKQIQIIFATKTKKQHIPYHSPTSHLTYDGVKIRNACSKIACIMGPTSGTPELVRYIEIVKILSSLRLHEMLFVKEQVDFVYGKIEALASNVTARNIEWFLGKLKLSNGLPLIHTLFTSPTILGKMNAIWKLLELYDILYKGIDWCVIQNVVQFLYSMIVWIMEKCGMAATFVIDKIKWVKATSNGKDDKLELQADDEVEMSPNDCLYYAIAPQADLSPTEFKKVFMDYLNLITVEDYNIIIESNGGNPSDEMPFDRVVSIANSCEMLEDIHILMMSECLGRNVFVHTDCQNVTRCNSRMINTCKQPIFVEHTTSPAHFRPGTIREGRLVSYFGIGAGDSNFIKCKCLNISSQQCAYCTANVCPKCFATCCENKAINYHTPSLIQNSEGNLLDNIETSDDETNTSDSSSNCSEPITKPIARVLPSVQIPVIKDATPVPPEALVPNTFWNRITNWWETICAFFRSLNINNFAQQVKEKMTSLFGNVYQWLNSNPLAVGLFGLISAMGTVLGISVPLFTNAGDKRSVITKLSDATRTIYYTQRSANGIMDSVKSLSSAIADCLGISTDAHITSFKEELLTVSQKAEAMLFTAQSSPATFANDGQKLIELKRQIVDVQKIYQDLVKYSDKANLNIITPIWNSLAKTKMSLDQMFLKFTTCLTTRQEPVIIWLHGKTNIGKSQLANEIIQRLCKSTGRDMKVFTVSKGPEHFNGFCGQEIIRIDDFGAWVQEGVAHEGLTLFNLKTMAPWNPSMAHLDDKNFMATPRFIIVCSNHPTISINSGATDMMAFERRRDIFVHVSWPDHESACEGHPNCHHLTKLQEDLVKNKVMDFSHLTLTAQNPCVTRFESVNNVDYAIQEASDLGVISLDEMINRAATLERRFNATYEVNFNNSLPKTQATREKFEAYPNIMLAGPPGTGKSFILDSIKQKIKVMQINSEEELTKFVSTGFAVVPDIQMVVFDDLSTFVANEKMHDSLVMILRQIKKRADELTTDTPWIMGVNLQILEPLITHAFSLGTDVEAQTEALSMFYRRVVMVNTLFKRHGWMRKPYTSADTLALTSSSIDTFVQYTWAGERVSQETVIQRAMSFQARIITIESLDSIPDVPAQTPSAYIELKMTTSEFMDIINTQSIPSILNLFRSERIRTCKGILKERDLMSKIYKSIQDAKSHIGCSYDDFDQFLLECSNQNFFREFAGIVLYMRFSNAVYSLQDNNNKVIACRVIDPSSEVTQAKIALAGVVKTIKTADFLSFSVSQFSPWFCFVGDMIGVLTKVGITSLSVAQSIVYNNNANIGINLLQKVDSIVASRLEEEIDDIPQKFNKYVISNVDKRNKTLLALNTPEVGIYDSIATNWKTVNETDQQRQRGKVDKYEEETAALKKRGGKNQKQKTRTTESETFWPGKAPRETETSIKGENTQFEYADLGARGTQKIVLQAVMKPAELGTLASSGESVPVAQICDDKELLPVIDSVLGNMVRIVTKFGKFLCYGLMIGGKLGTTVGHLQDLEKDENLFVEDLDGVQYTMKTLRIVRDEDRMDFVIESKKTFRNIQHHLTSATYKDYVQLDGVLCNLSRSAQGGKPVVVLRTYQIRSLTSRNCDLAGKSINLIEFGGFRMGSYISNIMTQKGDCGSIMFVSDRNHRGGKIIGMHSRATNTMGYLRPMYHEQYVDTELQCDEERVYGLFLKDAVPHFHEDSEAYATYKTYHTSETRLYTNVAPIGPPLYEPSILSNKDQRNPGHSILQNEADKWLIKPPEMSIEDKNLYRECVNDIAWHVASTMEQNHCRVQTLTKLESINKYRYATHSEPIPVNTSAGYPWNMMADLPQKKSFFSVCEKTGIRRFKNNRLVDKLHVTIDKLKQNLLKCSPSNEPIFQVLLKDEPVKLKKIYELPKTRTIAACPLHVTILMRQYLHAVDASLADLHLEQGPAIGIDPCSADWDFMWKKMCAVGGSAIAMDYAGWDFTVHPFEIEASADFYNVIYQQLDPNWKVEDNVIRTGIFALIAHGSILVGSKIYKIKRGVLSGLPITAIINSVINWARKLFAWKKLMKKYMPNLLGSDHFFKYTYCKFYGDDFFVVIADFLKEVYNAHTIKEVEESVFGVELTSPDKESEIQKLVPLHKISFMSRDFVLIGDRCYGRLEWDRVCKPTWWVHDTRKHKIWENIYEPVWNLEHAFSAYESALMEAVPWGMTKFNEIREAAQKAFNKLGYPKVLPDFRTMFAETQGFPAPESMLRGVTIMDALAELSSSGIVKPSIPDNAKVFSNRTTWHYGKGYQYVGADHPPRVIPPQYRTLLNLINEKAKKNWNSMLFNYYPEGGSIPFHKDNENELDLVEGVGCLTVYGNGTLALHKSMEPLWEINLKRGDLYIMGEDCLKQWRHRRYNHTLPTVSITFRKINVPSFQ